MVVWVRQVAHQSLQYYHNLYSTLEDVERDFVPFVDFHPKHHVITDHEHQLELGCSGLDHHHLYPSFDSYCVVYTLICGRKETRVLFLYVYLAYKEVCSARIKNNRKVKLRKY